jgi:hypothetical protein
MHEGGDCCDTCCSWICLTFFTVAACYIGAMCGILEFVLIYYLHGNGTLKGLKMLRRLNFIENVVINLPQLLMQFVNNFLTSELAWSQIAQFSFILSI